MIDLPKVPYPVVRILFRGAEIWARLVTEREATSRARSLPNDPLEEHIGIEVWHGNVVAKLCGQPKIEDTDVDRNAYWEELWATLDKANEPLTPTYALSPEEQAQVKERFADLLGALKLNLRGEPS